MGILSKTGKALVKTGDAAANATKAAKPGPDPITTLMLADIALRGGGRLLRHVVEIGLLGKTNGPRNAGNPVKGRTMGQTLIGTAIARIATRSVPGALLVGGGLLAKTLYDRKRGKEAEAEGRKAVEKQSRRGRS